MTELTVRDSESWESLQGGAQLLLKRQWVSGDPDEEAQSFEV